MSPKVKSILSVIISMAIVFGIIAYKFLSVILAFIASTMGVVIIIILFLLLIPYILYRIFLKIYS